MRKNSTIVAAVLAIVFLAGVAGAQMGPQMMGQGLAGEDDHTAREEAEGKAVWEKLQAKEVQCGDLTEEDFGALGEYFMGQMLGSAHAAMNAMMTNMMGEEGEEAMHVVMGKRLSGCDANAAFPVGGTGFMPMMNMMFGGMMGGWGSAVSGSFGAPWGVNSFMMQQGGWQTPFNFGAGGFAGQMYDWSWLWFPLLIWSLAWKGVALWNAAERKESLWFVILLVVNTIGLLEIFYVFVIAKKPHHEKKEQTT